MRLPPLNAVRVFEAAGRLASFSRAAAELHVTPGAVSRQIAKLEAFLGLPLFQRGAAEMRLTEAGARYLPVVRDALERLRDGTQALASGGQETLHIWGSRFFIRLWLLPRLPGFQALHPGLPVRITTALPEDEPPADMDVAIGPDRPALAGLRSHKLLDRVVVPVCSPDYLRHAAPLAQPQDLANHALLQTPRDADDWPRWYALTGAPPVRLPRPITFTSTDVAYSAALDGLGIALGRLGFIEADLQAGRLVKPFDVALQSSGAFHLMIRDADPLPARIAIFRDWILAQLDSPAPSR